MNSKFLFISAGVSVLALGTIAGVSLGNNVNSAFAADHEHTAACTIHHYAQVNPTSTTYGVKEYWVCCTNHETMFAAPTSGTVSDATHDDKFAIASDDNRYIAPYVVPFDFSSGAISVTSTAPVVGNVGGYDGKVYTVKINETHDNAGGTYLFIGSYGFYLRGDQIRLANRSSGSFAEANPRTCTDTGFPQKNWQGKDAIVGLSATIKDDSKITLTFYYNYLELAHYDFNRVTSEIASADAKFEVGINGTHVSRCEISSPEA